MPIKMNEVIYGFTSEMFNYTVIWIKHSIAFNLELGTNYFEDNSVYVSDLLWLMDPETYGGLGFALKAPGKRADGISSVTVDVQVPQSYVVKDTTKLPLEAIDGSFAFILGGE